MNGLFVVDKSQRRRSILPLKQQCLLANEITCLVVKILEVIMLEISMLIKLKRWRMLCNYN